MEEKIVPTVGQWVAISNSGRGISHIGRISRVTKTMFFLEGMTAKFRHNCELIGQETWDLTTAKFVTEEQMLAFRLKELRSKRLETLRNNMSRLDYDRLTDIDVVRLESFFPKLLKKVKKP